jgi:uncharacterized membrane protein
LPKFANPSSFFLLVGSIAVLALAVLTPPFQTPDEQQHLLRAYQLSELHVMPQRSGALAGGYEPRSISVSAQSFLQMESIHDSSPLHKVPLSLTKRELARPLNPQDRSFQEFLTLYFPTGYAPQVVGVWIGRAVGLGPAGLLLAARLMNAICAIGVVWLALRAMPAGSAVGLFVAMMPTSLAAFASASPDALTIATAIALAAFAQRAVIGQSALLGMSGAISTLCLTKFAYMPLAAAGAGAGKSSSRARHLALAAVAGMLVLAWLKLTSSGIVDLRPGADVAKQSQFVLHHPLAFVAAVGRTLAVKGGVFWMQAVGVLGWLDVQLPSWVYRLSATMLFLAVLSPTAKVNLPASAFLWWVLLAGVSVLLIFLAMYLPWTPVGYPTVRGFQGRYFVPLLPLLACGAAAVCSRLEISRLRSIAYVLVLVFLAAQSLATIYSVTTNFGVFG